MRTRSPTVQRVIKVTDMILAMPDLTVPQGPTVELVEPDPEGRTAVLDLVSAEHRDFFQYYDSPAPSTYVMAVREDDQLVGAVLLAHEPAARESDSDAALAALVIASHHRGRGLASAAIGQAARKLEAAGFSRVIAEWVWSVAAYARFGFKVWRTRTINR
jgi:GNAT superfamily N-acetyltransferase